MLGRLGHLGFCSSEFLDSLGLSPRGNVADEGW